MVKDTNDLADIHGLLVVDFFHHSTAAICPTDDCSSETKAPDITEIRDQAASDGRRQNMLSIAFILVHITSSEPHRLLVVYLSRPDCWIIHCWQVISK